MAKENKDQNREKRGFKKKADTCASCVFYFNSKYVNGTCDKDSFRVNGSSYCNEFEVKNEKTDS